MLKRIKIASKLKVVVLTVLVFFSIGFTERKNTETACSAINVVIENTEGNYFLDKEAIIDLVTARGKSPLIGVKLIHIELKTLETRLKKDKFVKNVQITKNLKGSLSIHVTQRRPIARFLTPDSSFYLGKEGCVLPLSNRYTARVMLVSGAGVKGLFQEGSVVTKKEKELFEVLGYINEDRFLKAQIAEIEVSKKGELIMYPQVTRQPIFFGACEKHVDKFKNLRVFYDKILPAKGWNDYESVNLKYQGQIICK